MRNKSINQINAFCDRNQTIAHYKYFDSNQAKYANPQPWQTRYFDYQYQWRGETYKRRVTPVGNWIYGDAIRELAIYRGTDDNYNYERDTRHVHLDIDDPAGSIAVSITAWLKVDIDGVWIRWDANMKRSALSDEPIIPRTDLVRVRSNQTFEALDIEAYFTRFILSKYLYQPGLFRDIQLYLGLSKADAKKWYAVARQRSKEKATINPEKPLLRRIRRKLNIDVKDWFTDRQLVLILKSQRRRKVRHKLFKQPSPFELLDRYHQEYDTDDHLEQFVNEELDDFGKHVIFV